MATLTGVSLKQGQVDKKGQPVWRKRMTFNAQSPAGNITNQDIGDMGGALGAVRVKFGETAPNTLTIVIKDDNGIELVNETITASGSLYIEAPILFVDGMSISISGNTTVNATATIDLFIF